MTLHSRNEQRILASDSTAQASAGIIGAAATGAVEFIAARGGDVDRIFGAAGISIDVVGSTSSQVDLKSYCRLFELAAFHTKLDNFGLWFGNQMRPRDLGLWGYSTISAPTLGHAVDSMSKFFCYHQEASRVTVSRGADGLMRLEYQIDVPDIVERRQDAELSLSAFVNVFRECLGPRWTPEEVHFEHPRPLDDRDHKEVFGAPVYFSLPCNAIVFRPDILCEPMPHHDVKLMSMMHMCLEQQARSASSRRSVIGQLKSAVRSKLLGGYPKLDDVSETLRVPISTVQRSLADQGLIYREFVEQIRRELALVYLKQRHLPISEIALLLGYSEQSAFSRAVLRWTGQSPRSYRRRIVSAVVAEGGSAE